MTPNAARAIIYQEFADNWSVSPKVPFTFDNENFDSEGLTEWVHLTVQHTPIGGQHTLGTVGNRIFRRRAVTRILIYTTVDRGLQRFDELALAARNIFEAKTISLVMFHNSVLIEPRRDEGWIKGTVNVFFTYDETR